MNRTNECVAMLLAGGQGKRLAALTDKLAKPAVAFGGKYRIIDFALSNCANSGIYTVGVLTQYEPLVLSEYIGSGAPWDLDRREGGVTVLPPYQNKDGGRWYAGTADAVWQNIDFIRRRAPEYVLILSGDHVYKMDYSEMIMFHRESDAEATVAAITVPRRDASAPHLLRGGDDRRKVAQPVKPRRKKQRRVDHGRFARVKRVERRADQKAQDGGMGNGVELAGAFLIPERALRQLSAVKAAVRQQDIRAECRAKRF